MTIDIKVAENYPPAKCIVAETHPFEGTAISEVMPRYQAEIMMRDLVEALNATATPGDKKFAILCEPGNGEKTWDFHPPI